MTDRKREQWAALQSKRATAAATASPPLSPAEVRAREIYGQLRAHPGLSAYLVRLGLLKDQARDAYERLGQEHCEGKMFMVSGRAGLDATVHALVKLAELRGREQAFAEAIGLVPPDEPEPST